VHVFYEGRMDRIGKGRKGKGERHFETYKVENRDRWKGPWVLVNVALWLATCWVSE
jgi:hypothetical protein